MKISQISNFVFEELLPLHPNIKPDELQTKIAEKLIINLGLIIDLPDTDVSSLTRVFTHKSFAHEIQRIAELKHNEVLEFLGDAVLDLIVSQELIDRYPKMSEGELSKLRSSIVNENTLSSLALSLNFNEIILVGKGEIKGRGFENRSLLSNTFEAFIGAIYKVHGLDTATSLFLQICDRSSLDIWSLSNLERFDAKTRLQELTMKIFGELPVYECSESANGKFTIECFLKDKSLGRLNATSKKKGMQELAFKILKENDFNNQEK